jgi:hypothetical protein
VSYFWQAPYYYCTSPCATDDCNRLGVDDYDTWYSLLRRQNYPDLTGRVLYARRWQTGTFYRPWLGQFANNTKITSIFNTYNPGDQVLSKVWWLLQAWQKPYFGVLGIGIPVISGGHDNRELMLWGNLPNTALDQEYLWSLTAPGDHSGQTRKWAELAYYFGALSTAAGGGEVVALNQPNDLRNFSFGTIGGSFSFQGIGGLLGTTSHGYMRDKSLPEVFCGWVLFRNLLRDGKAGVWLADGTGQCGSRE